MHGKTVLITGGSSGIGLETARGLAQMGAHIVIVGRNAAKTAAAVDDLRRSTGNDEIHSLLADLSLMAETRKLADSFLTQYGRLDVLINNAGAMYQSRTYTSEGLEYTFALNHMSYYLLTRLLLDRLVESRPARVVNTSSGAHYLTGGVNFDDLQRRRGWFIGFRRYNETKLMNVLFTLALARRVDASAVTVNAIHPGLVASGFGLNDAGPLSFGVALASRLFGLSTAEGARTGIHVASSPVGGQVTGSYFDKCKVVTPAERALDVEAQERLWTVSAELAGLPV